MPDSTMRPPETTMIRSALTTVERQVGLTPIFWVSRRSAIRAAQRLTQPNYLRTPRHVRQNEIARKPRDLAGVKRTTDQKVAGSNPSGRANVFAGVAQHFHPNLSR